MTMSDSAARWRIRVMKQSCVARARRADAALGRGREIGPDRQVLGQVLEFRAVAGLRPLRPVADGRHRVRVGERHRHRVLAELIEAVQAEVVAPPLHVGRLERDAERRLQEREVLREDLFLERLGAGRDEDAAAAQDGRDEVGDASCRCRCRPRRGGRGPARWRPPRPPPSRAGPGAARTPAPRAPAGRRRRTTRSTAAPRLRAAGSILPRGIRVRAFERHDLVDPALVASACERRLEEEADDGEGEVGPGDPRAEREDVGVVVLAREAGGLRDRRPSPPGRRRSCWPPSPCRCRCRR